MVKNDDKVPLSLRIPRDMMRDIREVRKAVEARTGYRVTLSAVVRQALREGLNRQKGRVTQKG